MFSIFTSTHDFKFNVLKFSRQCENISCEIQDTLACFGGYLKKKNPSNYSCWNSMTTTMVAKIIEEIIFISLEI